MCASGKIHGEGSAESAKVQLDWQCFYQPEAEKGTRDNKWTNAAKMGQGEWYKMYVRPFHPGLAFVGMLVLVQVISACSCEIIGLPVPTGTFTGKCATGLHLQVLRSQSKFIPIEGQWYLLLVMLKIYSWDDG